MKIYNPTNQPLKVQIKGTTYEVGAQSSIYNVSADHAEHWKTMLHNFIEVSEESIFSPNKVAETIEAKEENVEPALEIGRVLKKIKK